MFYALHSDRSGAGEDRHLQVRRWSTRNHNAQDVPLSNSRQLHAGYGQEMGHCTARFGTYSEMPNPPQGLNEHPKALSQGLGLHSGSQTSAGVVAFNL